MKAILTKRLPPTNVKPARIKAYDSDDNNVVLSVHSITFDKLNEEQMHYETARALAAKMNWIRRDRGPDRELRGGGTKEGYAWVFV